jgi:(p)ppGpp synthase/HD superfamily hydrolase
MATLTRAIEIATTAHARQTDKAGAPYIDHPMRVMAAVDGEEAKIVAVLHDVLEDCPPWTFEKMRAEGFSDAVMAGLDAVTKRDGEDYNTFVQRACADQNGRQVKVADLTDNMDIRRIANPTPKDYARVEKYRAALAMIAAL